MGCLENVSDVENISRGGTQRSAEMNVGGLCYSQNAYALATALAHLADHADFMGCLENVSDVENVSRRGTQRSTEMSVGGLCCSQNAYALATALAHLADHADFYGMFGECK